jgi:AraC-like DNA-binding protein
MLIVLWPISVCAVFRSTPDMVRGVLERRVRALWHPGDFNTVTQLKREIRVRLLAGGVSATEIASQLGMSRRTLDRRLSAKSVRFQNIVDDIRCELAQQLLAYTKLSIGEVGRIIGYADVSALTRAFVRWVGLTPTQWRLQFKKRNRGKVLVRRDDPAHNAMLEPA